MQQMDEIITYSQQMTKMTGFNIEPLTEQWLNAKKKFIDRFKDEKVASLNINNSEFIYEFPEPLTFTLDEDTKLSKVTGFIEYLTDYFCDHNVSDTAAYGLCRFLNKNKEGFYDNKVIWPGKGLNGEDINVGMRLLKAFKFFLKPPILEEVQNKASMLIQENKVTGRFCISVHPLDYLSASESNYDWRSCHALDGDYRSGNLSYMVDDCTVMCYLKGEEETILPRFPGTVPWNNKKWRMLLFLGQEENIVWAGRQYPFESSSILEWVRYNVVPIITGCPFRTRRPYLYLPTATFSDWENWNLKDNLKERQMLGDNYIKIDGFLFPKRSIIYNADSRLFYNDLLDSTKYIPSYLWKNEITHGNGIEDRVDDRFDLNSIAIHIGGDPICPCCGRNKVEFSDEMICVGCDEQYGTLDNDEFTVCADCGARIYRDNAYYDENDEQWYCDDCRREGEWY